jgi:nicotinamide-nucleotide amidase
MNAAIITIGQEILIGQIVDTNSSWISYQLNGIGINVQRIISISDSEDDIINTLNQLVKDFDFVITTGGLGPTSDDITKLALCKFFGCRLVVHEQSLDKIKHLFSSRGLPVTELNLKQAEVPEICEPLLNRLGTAPGMWFKVNNCNIISLPGVPFEMTEIMRENVLPRISQLNNQQVIVHRTLHTFGFPESFLAEKLSKWEKDLPESISIAYLPSPKSIRIRLSSTGINKEIIEALIQEQIEKLQTIIPENLFGFNENDTMASVVGSLLMQTNSKLSVAESCTGGNISHLLTMTPGSSEYFTGGIIAYSNQIKTRVLEVDEQLITMYGAVSQQVVEAMAQGVRKLMMTDYAIASSGIAGPDGGTEQKPVGTFWIAIASKRSTQSIIFRLGIDRERNIERGSVSALNMLRLQIMNEHKIKLGTSY